MTNWNHWRGVKALVHDGVAGASRSVERVQKETAKRWFDLLEAIPPLAAPARLVRVVHDGTTSAVHGAIRLTNGLVAAAADGALDALEAVDSKRQAETTSPSAEASSAEASSAEASSAEASSAEASSAEASPGAKAT